MQDITYELAIGSSDDKNDAINKKDRASKRNQNKNKTGNTNNTKRQNDLQGKKDTVDVEEEGQINKDITSGENITSNNNNNTTSEKTVNQQGITDSVARVTAMAAALNNIQTNVGSLIVGAEQELQYYNRKVKPLLDELYFLSLASQGMSIAAQNLQSNAYAKKREIKLAVDLTYESIKEAYCVLNTLKKRNAIYRNIVEEDIERCGGLPSNYKSCFDYLDEDDKHFDDDDKEKDCDKD